MTSKISALDDEIMVTQTVANSFKYTAKYLVASQESKLQIGRMSCGNKQWHL